MLNKPLLNLRGKSTLQIRLISWVLDNSHWSPPSDLYLLQNTVVMCGSEGGTSESCMGSRRLALLEIQFLLQQKISKKKYD